jgi:hypothetical protein
MSFSIKCLYTQPNVVEIIIYHKAYTQIDGSFAHGEHDSESISYMFRYAPRIYVTNIEGPPMGLTKFRLHDQTNI